MDAASCAVCAVVAGCASIPYGGRGRLVMNEQEAARWEARLRDLGWPCERRMAPPWVHTVELLVEHPQLGPMLIMTERQCVELLWGWYWGGQERERRWA